MNLDARRTIRTVIDDIYPLSPMQQGMLFHALYEPHAGADIVQLRYTLRGRLDAVALERAWQSAVDRQPVLRTAFRWQRLQRPLQVVFGDVSRRRRFIRNGSW